MADRPTNRPPSQENSAADPCAARRLALYGAAILHQQLETDDPPMSFKRTAAAIAVLAVSLGLGSAAYADPCDDLAKQLADHITGVKIGKTIANVIYLEHSAVKQAWLGCSGQNVRNEVAASSPTVKPSKDFLSFVAEAAAVVFTIPKDDALRGVQRCAGRIGLLRGSNIETRYRKLDIHCTRTKETTQISVSREKQT
jgi:hypothetical protein